MEDVTAEQCKAVVKETGMTWLGHHRCGCCGSMVGYRFEKDTGAPPEWQERLGLNGPDDVVALFDSSCDCSSRSNEQPTSWSEFAHGFNMQPTPEGKARMWERFKAGKATHEAD